MGPLMPGHLTDNASHTRNSKRCNLTRGGGLVLENETTKMMLLLSVEAIDPIRAA